MKFLRTLTGTDILSVSQLVVWETIIKRADVMLCNRSITGLDEGSQIYVNIGSYGFM